MEFHDIINKYLADTSATPQEFKDAVAERLSIHDICLVQMALINAVTTLTDSVTEIQGHTEKSIVGLRQTIQTLRSVSEMLSKLIYERPSESEGEQ